MKREDKISITFLMLNETLVIVKQILFDKKYNLLYKKIFFEIYAKIQKMEKIPLI